MVNSSKYNNKEKKALLVGSSFSAAPIFFALKNYGLHVSVCGNVESDPCHQYADASFYIDYSNPDELQKVIELGNFDYLVPTCNDYSYMSCAAVASKYGFTGFDSYEKAISLHTKDKFRKVISDLGLPAPSYTVLHSSKDLEKFSDLKYPLLVKPIDSFSGRGMTKVNEITSLQVAIDKAFKMSRNNNWVVLEQFVEGSLHSHSAFIQDLKIETDFFVDEYCTVYPYQVDCSNHPSLLKDIVKDKVRSAISHLVHEMQITDGLLHTQFISQGEEIWIVETMRRSPGDLYGRLIELSTGIDYNKLFVQPYLNEKYSADSLEDQARFYGRHTVSVDQPLVNFSFSENIPSTNTQIVPLKSSGEYLNVAPFDKLAIIFSEFDSSCSMNEHVPRFSEYIYIYPHGE